MTTGLVNASAVTSFLKERVGSFCDFSAERLAVPRRVALVLLGLSLAACSSTKSRVDTPATAKGVDLNRYLGRWFEIARLPMAFQKANEAAIAEYGSNADGTV